MNLEEILLAKLFAEQVVSEALVDVNTLRFEEVSHIPAPEDAEANVIYLYKNSFSGFYDMYVLINGQVRHLDDTTVDLSSYAKKTELPTKISQLTNDEGFLQSSFKLILLPNFVSVEDLEKIKLGEDIDSLDVLFSEIEKFLEPGGVIPILIFPYGNFTILWTIETYVCDNNLKLEQLVASMFTNTLDGQWYYYNYNLDRSGHVTRRRIQPYDIEKVYFDVYEDSTVEEGHTSNFTYEHIIEQMNLGKEIYLRLHLESPSKEVLILELGGITNGYIFFVGGLKINSGQTYFPVFVIGEDLETFTSISLPSQSQGTTINSFELSGTTLTIYTDEETFSVDLYELEGPEGPEGPEGSEGRGISNIYFEGTSLNFEMDDGEIINVGEIPGIEIEYPIAEPVADAVGDTPTAAEFNALLASLRAAGILAE